MARELERQSLAGAVRDLRARDLRGRRRPRRLLEAGGGRGGGRRGRGPAGPPVLEDGLMPNKFLRKVPLFADLSDPDLDRLCRMIEEVALPSGQTLFKEGEPGERAYVIKEGQLEILKAAGGREVLLAVREPGDVSGEGALLEEAPRMATARARIDSSLLAIHKAQLDELVQTSASAARGMFFTVLGRWRSTSAMLRQSEKMAQLGTLTAGVAHELNNPAAAVKRGAAQLEEALADLMAAERAVGRLGLSAAEDQSLQALGRKVRVEAGRP